MLFEWLSKDVRLVRGMHPAHPQCRRWVSFVLVVGVSIAAATDAVAQDTPSSIPRCGCIAATPVLIDPDMSPQAGATVTLAIGRALAHAEDRVVPTRLFVEQGKLRHTANAGYRLAKLLLFDQPQENWLRVANHEVFGHGARIRELFEGGHVSYELPAPPPYGRGGGATSFAYTRLPTVEEALAVTVAGMEANQLLGLAIAKDALTTGEWTYRDARQYLYAENDAIRYIGGVSDLEPEGHDVGDFLRIYNEAAMRGKAATLSARTLRRRVLASFANPLLAYSYYSSYVSYVWSGHTTSPLPMLHLGQTRYLPMARFQLTPFGTQWRIDNDFVRNGRFTDLTLYVGHTIGASTYGIGLQRTRVATIGGWMVDGRGVVWHQPQWGGEIEATAMREIPRLRRASHGVALVVQGGMKSDGFLAGGPIHQGGFIRVGAALVH